MKITARLLPLLALPALLAACGTASTGEGTVKFNDLKTEYKDAAGNYVACDNVTKQDSSTTKITTVAVYYTATGTISSVNIGLKGSTTSTYDNNYTATVQGSNLQSIGGNDFKTVFTADASSALLPQAIVVNPNPNVFIKNVTTSNKVGSFYAKLTVNTPNGTASTTSTSALLPAISVYQNCTVTGTTATQL
ncbi:hypothetical protein DKM44_08080 [Deinococcus irradiatisoli]|uniref:Lipoprotein n=1 Tax=Deinococcus irradiatisoli TaxID=2202254 RepID=A0A2Z3JNR7_9DEIO|nr:hypothetical protein [Deinococcus irradiatisoli]AWN23188.1 hypothetical protein DKM44_08080 [Deinococcus irradiatisoli]